MYNKRNSNYNLLAYIIETLTGETYGEFLDRVFTDHGDGVGYGWFVG